MRKLTSWIQKTVDDLLSSKHTKTRTFWHGVLMVFDGVLNRILGRSSDEVPRIRGHRSRTSQVMTDHFFPERDLWDERWRDEELRRQVIGVMKHGWEMLELSHGKIWNVGKSPK